MVNNKYGLVDANGKFVKIGECEGEYWLQHSEELQLDKDIGELALLMIETSLSSFKLESGIELPLRLKISITKKEI